MPARKNAPPIVLLTDFGYRDHYVGVMKGVIAGIAPAAPVVDLTHGVSGQSVPAGALVLAQSWRFFPARSIFVAVVDPGVGTARRAIAIETKSGARMIGPDNGVLSLAAVQAGIRRVVEVRAPRYRLNTVSATFHGRDIFAPAAAHLWTGVRLTALGSKLDAIEQFRLAVPAIRDGSLLGEVIYIDGFGNLITNIDRETLTNFSGSFRGRELLVRINSSDGFELVHAYGDAKIGAPLAAFGSFELLEIAIRDGSAAARFGAREGAIVTVTAKP